MFSLSWQACNNDLSADIWNLCNKCDWVSVRQQSDVCLFSKYKRKVSALLVFLEFLRLATADSNLRLKINCALPEDECSPQHQAVVHMTGDRLEGERWIDGSRRLTLLVFVSM